MCGASLAHYGLLGSVDWLIQRNVDLSPVPAQHLASLVSCVTSLLQIRNVSGCDLVSLLTSLKCPGLDIASQSLGREETQALVQAMEFGVEKVTLLEEVTLDMEALTQYSGQGVCWKVKLSGEITPRYREELRTWARSRNWKIAKAHEDEREKLRPWGGAKSINWSRNWNIVNASAPEDERWVFSVCR